MAYLHTVSYKAESNHPFCVKQQGCGTESLTNEQKYVKKHHTVRNLQRFPFKSIYNVKILIRAGSSVCNSLHFLIYTWFNQT